MKMRFFKTAIMSLMLVFGVSAANAQMGQMPSPEEMAKFQADQMKQTVNLNDDQYNKFKEILTDEQYKKWDEYQQEMRKNMGGFGGGGF